MFGVKRPAILGTDRVTARSEIEEVSQMFASVITTKGQPSKQEAKRVIDQVLPRAQSLPGFKGAIFLLDEKAGKGMAIALYENEEVARAAAGARDSLRREAASEVGASISSEESYEVLVASGVAAPIQA